MSAPARRILPMPRLGETMEEGTIAEWLVQPGQDFNRGDPLLEVETDKTLVEYPALGSGTLIETLAGRGDVIEVGKPIAVIETADVWEGIEGDTRAEPTPGHAGPGPAPAVAAPRSSDGVRSRATPLARRIARQNGIDLNEVKGTGRRGRIEAEDVRILASRVRAPARPMASGPTGETCFVHGFAGLGSNWAALRARLQRNGLAASAPDLPGHGANETEAPDVAALVDWLARDLSRRAAPVHLVGHSLGAHVAAQAALRDPSKVARLTLIAPAGCGLEINGSFLRGMARSPGAGALAHLLRLLGPKAGALDARALAAMVADLQAGRLPSLADDMVQGDTQRIDTVAPLNALSGLPIQAIFGLHDRIIPREHVFNLPPHVACHMIDAGHMPHWDAVEEVARIIGAA